MKKVIWTFINFIFGYLSWTQLFYIYLFFVLKKDARVIGVFIFCTCYPMLVDILSPLYFGFIFLDKLALLVSPFIEQFSSTYLDFITLSIYLFLSFFFLSFILVSLSWKTVNGRSESNVAAIQRATSFFQLISSNLPLFSMSNERGTSDWRGLLARLFSLSLFFCRNGVWENWFCARCSDCFDCRRMKKLSYGARMVTWR